MNDFYEDFENNKTIAIGQTFMVSSSNIEKWTKNKNTTLVSKDKYYEYFEYGYSDIDLDHSDILFIVKYIGNGYVQEMVTGEIMLLSRINKNLLEDNSDELVTADSKNIFIPTHFEDYENAEFKVPTIMEYVSELELYKKRATNSPLIYNVVDGDLMFKIDEISKKKYLEHSNEERIALMKKYKEEALSSLKEIIKEIDTTIQSCSSISTETLDMAHLENDIYNFEKQEKTR